MYIPGLPLLPPMPRSRRMRPGIVRLGIARHRALSAVTTVTVALGVRLGSLRRGRRARDGVCGLRGGDFGLVLVPQAREEGGFLGAGGGSCHCDDMCGWVGLGLCSSGTRGLRDGQHRALIYKQLPYQTH